MKTICIVGLPHVTKILLEEKMHKLLKLPEMFRKNIKLLSIVFFSTELEASGQIFRQKLPLGFSEVVGRILETVKCLSMRSVGILNICTLWILLNRFSVDGSTNFHSLRRNIFLCPSWATSQTRPCYKLCVTRHTIVRGWNGEQHTQATAHSNRAEVENHLIEKTSSFEQQHFLVNIPLLNFRKGSLKQFSSDAFFYVRLRTCAQYASMNEFAYSEHSVRIRT